MMGRCQLVAGRQEGTKGVETLSRGVVSSCALLQIESPKINFKLKNLCGSDIIRNGVDVGKVCWIRPKSRDSLPRSGEGGSVVEGMLSIARGII